MATQVELIKKYGLAVRGKLGQHLLLDPNIQRKITALLNLRPEDRVLEIGPGLGALTGLILESGCRLAAVEKDSAFVRVLSEEFENSASGRFTIFNEDILDFNWDRLAPGSGRLKVISNMPYYITAPILMELTARRTLIAEAVLMMQKEVALRLTAKPGTKDYGRLTLAVQMAATIEHGFNVPAGCFTPKPKVDSTVLKLKFHSKPLCKNPQKVLKLVQTAFSQRRKTLAGLLAGGEFKLTREKAAAHLSALGFPKTVRGEALSLEHFIRLAERL